MVVVAPLPDGVHRIVATVDEAPEQPDAAYVQALLDARGPRARARRRARGAVGLALSRAPPRRRRLPRGPRAAGRRCRACAQPGRRPGHERRHPRRDAAWPTRWPRRWRATTRRSMPTAPSAARWRSRSSRWPTALTRLATVRPRLRALRNLLLSALSRLPRVPPPAGVAAVGAGVPLIGRERTVANQALLAAAKGHCRGRGAYDGPSERSSSR